VYGVAVTGGMVETLRGGLYLRHCETC
jgi:hypothetical protein